MEKAEWNGCISLKEFGGSRYRRFGRIIGQLNLNNHPIKWMYTDAALSVCGVFSQGNLKPAAHFKQTWKWSRKGRILRIVSVMWYLTDRDAWICFEPISPSTNLRSITPTLHSTSKHAPETWFYSGNWTIDPCLRYSRISAIVEVLPTMADQGAIRHIILEVVLKYYMPCLTLTIMK